ncbi:MAG: metallophosphoesterase [Desulfobacterales bacterium]
MNFVKSVPRSPASAHPCRELPNGPEREATLIHLSDFHLFDSDGITLRALLSKRGLSFLSWKLNRRRENLPRVLRALITAVKAMPWDQVVITGDLTHMGMPGEIRLAGQYLEMIGTPERVMVVPGNHDILVKPAGDDPLAGWGGYTDSDRILPEGFDERAGIPALRIRNGMALIGMSSACPTPPFSAAGRMGLEQGRSLARILSVAKERGLFRVVLIHHPVLAGLVSGRKSLSDSKALRRILRTEGAELVLHGHTHRDFSGVVDGPSGSIPVFGLPSSSAEHAREDRRARFRRFSVRPVENEWRLSIEDHLFSNGGIVKREIGDILLPVPPS